MAPSLYARSVLLKATEPFAQPSSNGTSHSNGIESNGNSAPPPAEENGVGKPVISEKAQRAIAYLQRRREEDYTDDPEEIRQAELELDEFKRNMNANRGADERVLYPDVA